jgi:hypothetical protein
MQEQGQPSPLDLSVWSGLGVGQGLRLSEVGLREARLVLGRRATVPGSMGTGRKLYRRQWRASVGRIVGKTTLPTDAPFLWLPFVAVQALQ